MVQLLVDTILPQLEEIILQSSGDDRPHSERSLSKQLGVSRSILREALRSLRQQGLVEILPGKGIFPAHNIDKPTILNMQNYLRRKEIGFRELLEARLFLETHIAFLAAERRTDRDLTLLADVLSRMEDGLHKATVFEQADHDFHHVLAASTGNDLYLIWLQPIIGMLKDRLDRLVTLGEVRENALKAHRAIYEAVAAGDGAAARREMQKHLHGFEENTKLAIKLGLLPPDDEDLLPVD